MGEADRQSAVAEQCDVCMEERTSVREGDLYICEVCLDGNPPVMAAETKV